MQAHVRYHPPILKLYCHVDILRLVAVHPRVLEPGSRHHTWRGGSLFSFSSSSIYTPHKQLGITRIDFRSRLIEMCIPGNFRLS